VIVSAVSVFIRFKHSIVAEISSFDAAGNSFIPARAAHMATRCAADLDGGADIIPDGNRNTSLILMSAYTVKGVFKLVERYFIEYRFADFFNKDES